MSKSLHEPHYNLGNTLGDKGRLDEAIPHYREAIRLKPNYAPAYHRLGNALMSQGKPDEAIACCREAVRFQPNRRGLHYDLGEAFLEKGQLEEALAAYRGAAQHTPDDAPAQNAVGGTLSMLGRLDEALPFLREAVRLAPRYAHAHINLGIVLARKGLWGDAITALGEAIRLQPNLPMPHNNLAWILATCPDLKYRDPYQALRLAYRAVELAPQVVFPWGTLGVVQYRLGDWKAAIASLEKAMLLRKGGHSNDFFFLAMAHWQLEDKDQARQWYDRAVQWVEKNRPQDEELRRFRAEAAELLGIAKAAEEPKDEK